MKIKFFATIGLMSVLFFPLNNISSFGGNNITTTTNNINLPITINSTPTSEEKLDEYLDCFDVISKDAMKYALSGYMYLKEQGKLNKEDIITICDFSKPSTEERFFIVNLKTKKIIAKSLVAHGKNSGEIWAEKFSNGAESYQSSLGFYVTAETYEGKNGFSLKLDGLENGINTNARDRGVVIHAADYVSKDFINANGKLGRSQGCPALPIEKNSKLINIIKGGSCFFIYHPTKNYAKNSTIIKNYNESCLAESVCNTFVAAD